MTHSASLAYAYGGPLGSAVFKRQPDDFQVDECLAYSLTGQGEHLWLWVEKIGQNTDWVSQQLAKLSGIKLRDVGYAGLKDRHGVTRQWFSLYLPGRADPDWLNWSIEGVKIISATRHHRKLQTGGLKGNRFVIRLRDVSADPAQLDERLQYMARQGVPNYYGPQRFGRNEHNLVMADRLLQGELTRLRPAQRGLYLSTARSFLFNLVLSARVTDSTWNQACSGDIFQLEGSTKWFADDGSSNLAERVALGDLHPTGPLVGEVVSLAQSDVGVLEVGTLSAHQAWYHRLAALGLKSDRRALRVCAQEMTWQWQPGTSAATPDLVLSFELSAGQYATNWLRELLTLN